jgi:hypothetical protein
MGIPRRIVCLNEVIAVSAFSSLDCRPAVKSDEAILNRAKQKKWDSGNSRRLRQ